VGLLAERGALVMEVGYAQSEDVRQLMSAAGLTLGMPVKADLSGIERAVAGRKLPP
jgi:release factor glutamine methyltransferase